jgi:hypothetical protein
MSTPAHYYYHSSWDEPLGPLHDAGSIAGGESMRLLHYPKVDASVKCATLGVALPLTLKFQGIQGDEHRHPSRAFSARRPTRKWAMYRLGLHKPPI